MRHLSQKIGATRYVFSNPFPEGLEDTPFRSSVSRSVIFFLIISLVLRPKYLVQIDKGGLPFRIFRGVHGVVQSLMLSNGQKRNLSSFRQRWWSVKNWFVQNKRTCIACYLLLFIVMFCKEKKVPQKNMILIENLQNQISQGQIELHTVV